MKEVKLSRSKKIKKWLIVILVLFVIIAIAFVVLKKDKQPKQTFSVESLDTTVQKHDITSSVTGSAVVKPKDQYSITALVSGNVLSANFEQGDMVKEGDVLYKIDSSDAQNSIENADISYQRSQMDYNNAIDNQNKLTVKSTIAGTVKTMYVKVGDSVNTGTKIADIYDDSSLTLTVAFNDAEAIDFAVGDAASVRVSSNGELLEGTVTEVGASGYASEGNTRKRNVKISVINPGALMNTETATAQINGFASTDAGSFEYAAEKTIVAEVMGDIDEIYVSESDKVIIGSNLVHIKSQSVENNVKSSTLSLRSSELSRQNAKDKLDDYTIKAPISGTVVVKNIKAGDKLDNTNMSTEMAIIYDMSSLECELSVDELDIKNVEIGQSVIIKSDAIEDRIYHGEVSNVSINGTTSGGVTTYPVTIVIKDFDEKLLPGMNIDVEITTSQAKDVISVPVNAVNRGNMVYVKGEKTDKNDKAPEGYKTVRVKTGVYNDEFIEIKEGLEVGDVVYTPQVKSTTGMPSMMGGMPGGGMMGGNMSGGMPSGAGSGGMPGGMSGGMR
ncbi:MAG: efflux RND transporter periplasmic adaptor subunit [Clostridia bacterium]|nr:efflux RND transporter periplasmic adaptor subunit [Clostridia bacterium]